MDDIPDIARQMRATHEAYEKEREVDEKKREKAMRRLERTSRIMWGSLVVMGLFDLYLWGPTIVQGVIKATAEWRALLF
jgi:hypothetical protein